MEKEKELDYWIEKELEKSFWEKISEEYSWSDKSLAYYQDKVDWNKISANYNIKWSCEMLRKYSSRINWSILSDTDNRSLYSYEILTEFSEKWNWKKLSQGSNNLIEFIDKFKDRWDWSEIIDNWDFNDYYDIEFYLKYKNYIPTTKLLDSRLWNKIIDKKQIQFINELTTKVY